MSSLALTVSDTWVLARRNLKRIPRQPDLLIAYTVQPVMFTLLFVYVFGGAIDSGPVRLRRLPDARASSSSRSRSAGS